MSSSPPTPTEKEECIAFVDWMDLRGLKFSHLAQSTFTKSFSVMRRNKQMGVRRGVPDYLIILPACKGLLFIEMKRTKRGVVSPEQQDWLNELNTLDGVEAAVCKGAAEAISKVETYL